jgi:uncharacterized Fe-S radical SAM superfamily protein PflX
MSDLGKLTIWNDPAIRGALSWYLDVAENRHPAKFRIAATIATQLDPAASSEDALWAELDRLTPIFLARWQAIRVGASLPQPADGPSLLELCRELAYCTLAHCNFCPWNCRVDRVAGTKFGCLYQELDTAIMVMKSAEDRNRRDAAYVLDRAMDRSVFAKRPMSPLLVIIGGISHQDAK